MRLLYCNFARQEIKNIENKYPVVVPIGWLHTPYDYNFLEAVVYALQ